VVVGTLSESLNGAKERLTPLAELKMSSGSRGERKKMTSTNTTSSTSNVTPTLRYLRSPRTYKLFYFLNYIIF
jgi:hypothetical protein